MTCDCGKAGSVPSLPVNTASQRKGDITMRRYFLYSVLSLALLVSGVMSAQAQLGVGAKGPPLILPTFLASYMLSETQMLELDVLYQSSGQSSMLSAGVSGKLFLDPAEVLPFAITPFLGAGARFSLISVHVLRQSSSITAISVNVFMGAEHRVPESRVNVFGEFRYSISLSLSGVGMGAALGLRLDL